MVNRTVDPGAREHADQDDRDGYRKTQQKTGADERSDDPLRHCAAISIMALMTIGPT